MIWKTRSIKICSNVLCYVSWNSTV